MDWRQNRRYARLHGWRVHPEFVSLRRFGWRWRFRAGAVSGPAGVAGARACVVASLQPLGDLPETNRLNLAIGLPLRHQDALNRLLHDLYDPASPRYRRFLKPKNSPISLVPAKEITRR
jgi:hypothetical protein